MRSLLALGSRFAAGQVGVVLAIVVLLWLQLPAGSVWSWVAIVVAGLALIVTPLSEVASSATAIRVHQLPGLTESRPGPGRQALRVASSGFVLLLVGSSFLSVWAVVVVATAGLVGQLWVVGQAMLRRRRRPAERAAVTRALEAHAPEFLLYTGRRNDAAYQLTMWLPLLEELGVPYAIIVRDAQAVSYAAGVTDAPVISCPSASDLDCVVVGSVKAAFYVNMVAENANFVLYRSMTHVYLGHGDSDKELSAHPAHAMFDRIFVAGSAARERYPRNGVLIPDEKFVVIGRPQLSDVQVAERPIGRTPVPTVLVAPTWRGYNARTTLSSMGSATVLVDALISRGAAVVFRPHPFSWQGRDDRGQITAVDERLRADRAATGRAHVLASEQRSRSAAEVFDLSDALVTDVGSLLVDYFVTQKPYAVVLPVAVTISQATAQFPTLEAAYLVETASLRDGGQDPVIGAWLDDLLGADPFAERRRRVSRHFLGDRPGESGPFLEAVRTLIER